MKTAALAIAATLALFLMLYLALGREPANSAPAESCSCAGRPDCEARAFVVDAESSTRAYCALWDGGEACCMVGQR